MAIDLTEPVGRIRLTIGDISDLPVLSDQQIGDTLEQFDNNEEKATRQCAHYILATLSMRGDVRLDRIQMLSSGVFEQYMRYLQYTINSPTSALNAVRIYACGVYKDDYEANILDDTVLHRVPTNPYGYVEGKWVPWENF